MDSAADSLLALSNTAVALAEADLPDDDEDRSSSLSELEDDEADNLQSDPPDIPVTTENDSEAETERLEESPDKLLHRKPFGISPSKLIHSVNVDERPEIESLTDSVVSSPISSREATPDVDGMSDVAGDDEVTTPANFERRLSGKRKRQSGEQDEEDHDRSARRRRTGSIASEDKSDPDSDADDNQSQRSREVTAEPEAELDGVDEDAKDEGDPADVEKADTSEDSKGKTRSGSSRAQRRRGKQDPHPVDEPEAEEAAEVGDESDEAEVDDVEATAKSEEEQAKRMAAMEALSALERHFATLRDRLYDERIAALNHELVQLADSRPSHPELLRQLEAVRKWRDDKYEVEQKLLVYKVGALKNKSVAERSQIHSAYFQTVRDIRERHLERASELFYRIQRDRFKSDTPAPSFTIPFPTRRSQQITHQTAYNKEVSILAGVAKYVGFPAAPELSQSRPKELEDDLLKIGISPSQVRSTRPLPRTNAINNFTPVLSGPAAEEQFLEQTPWANPQHPAHRLGMSRQNSDRSMMNDTFLTPANQQKAGEQPHIAGSASTIAEQISAPVSSNMNTPYDSAMVDANAGGLANYRLQSASPLEMRRANATTGAVYGSLHRPASQPRDLQHDSGSSPLMSRMGAGNSPPRAASTIPDKVSRMSNASPFRQPKDPAPRATTAAHAGSGRLGLM